MLNKKVLLSLLFIGVVAAAAGSGTWAQFYDVETSSANTFAAGELDLKIDGEDWDGTAVVKVENTYPGASESTPVTLYNAGSMEGSLVFDIAYTESGGAQTEPETSAGDVDDTSTDGDLDDYLQITIIDGSGATDGSEVMYDGTLAAFPATGVDLNNLDALASETYTVTYEVLDTATDMNIIQGDSVTLEMTITMDQVIA